MAVYQPVELEIVYFDQPEIFLYTSSELPLIPFEP